MSPPADLCRRYRAYLDCLNRRDWPRLSDHVREDVSHNDRPFGLPGYRRMIEDDVAAIPDLRFELALLLADGEHVSARLRFDCTPSGDLFGLPVHGRRVVFHEHVFYRYRAGRIAVVHSLIDRDAIAAQLASPAR